MSTNPTHEPQYLTLRQAAQLTQLCTKTLRRAIARGLLVASQPGGRDYRLTRDSIRSWMEQTRATTSTANT